VTRTRTRPANLEALWAHHHAELRDPLGVAVQWDTTADVDPGLLRHTVRGRFWEAVGAAGGAILVTREYEHLVVALTVTGGRRRVSYLRLPHPNGLAVDRDRGLLYVASTRNPNMLFELAPVRDVVARDGATRTEPLAGALVPVRCRYLPGALYIHDLALVGGRLHANAVALNAVVELPERGGFNPVWWPRAIDGDGRPLFGRNYLQLNSIAAGRTLASSFFSASAAVPSARRPGHLNFPVDGRGVIFSGRTRDVVATGLTRPHSARLRQGTLWVDNSGYGEFGRIAQGRFEPLVRLPGWTRGLCIAKNIAFVGTSHVIPRFRHYAPGVDASRSESAVHAVDLATGRVLGSLVWPQGNQIFAVEDASALGTIGFPFDGRARSRPQIESIFLRGNTRGRSRPRTLKARRG
jgi:uncharacterized protein (TIGR03032 family)